MEPKFLAAAAMVLNGLSGAASAQQPTPAGKPDHAAETTLIAMSVIDGDGESVGKVGAVSLEMSRTEIDAMPDYQRDDDRWFAS